LLLFAEYRRAYLLDLTLISTALRYFGGGCGGVGSSSTENTVEIKIDACYMDTPRVWADV